MCRYFAFTFLFFLAHQFALSLFRTIAAITRSLVLAYPCAWLMFLTILLLGGFILNKRERHSHMHGSHVLKWNGKARHVATGKKCSPACVWC